MIKLVDPLQVINKIKEYLSEIIEENNLNFPGDIDNILRFYSMDFAKIMIDYYPGATIMMHKFYRSCAVMIGGKVYNETGLVSRLDYHIALEEEINYIKNTFPRLPEVVINNLNEKLKKQTDDISYVLKNNVDKK